jgi:hypothetical protein
MGKYIIDGDIDFYAELYKSLDQEEEKSPKDSTDLCLITNEPLSKHYITLECNHKFNYLAIYHDILNHKKKYNTMERSILKSKQIRCPYCRHVQQNLLPYIEETGVSKVHGVNYFDECYHIKVEYVSHKYAQDGYFVGNCAYVVKDAFDNFVECSTKYVKNLHLDNKCYCSHHKLFVMKKYMLDRKNKAKLEAKEKAKQEKEKVKQEKLEEKEKAKQAKLHATEENVVLQVGQCCQILKTGPNKGKPCCKKVHQDHLCLRHFPPLKKVEPNQLILSTFEKSGAKSNP